MAHPIKATTFYSKKKPGTRVVIPAELNNSFHSDSEDSDNSEVRFGSRDYFDDTVILETDDSKCEADMIVERQRTHSKKKILSTHISNRFAAQPSRATSELETESQDFTLRFELSQESTREASEDVDNLSSPCVSPILSMLNSSPDLFEESGVNTASQSSANKEMICDLLSNKDN